MNATPVGALLLCRADTSAVRTPAQLLREPQLLAPAGAEWSVLVPGGGAWSDGEPVDRVLAGWAVALAVAVGAGRPVLALWWDADRAGFTLASGFRRPVGYVWLADGTPAGEDEAMRTFATRLGLDPVLDVQDLEPLTREDTVADAQSRLVGLTAVLTRAGVSLPPGLTPGLSTDRLSARARELAAEPVEWAGWRGAVRTELHAVEESLDHWLREPAGPAVPKGVGAAQLAVGLPLVLWGLRRGATGWAVAGGILAAQGALVLAQARRAERRRIG
jgi:hypothetical protein